VVLPSVAVDLLLDNHAVEFEECKRWANSEAGQSARMTNPAGFANVRAHAEAHLRAMTPPPPEPIGASQGHGPQVASNRHSGPSHPPDELHTTSATRLSRTPGEFSSPGEEQDGLGDHWVTIDGSHVLIHEAQGKQDAQTPQGLAAQIPCHVKAAIAASIKASNSPTPDDKTGGFHEEGGQWVIAADGTVIPVPAKPGPANTTIKEGGVHLVPSDAIDPSLKDNIVGLGGTWHIHPSGELVEQAGNLRNTKNFNQPPSGKDIKEAGAGVNVVVGARENKVYFYNNSGAIGQPMKLRDFLKGC